MASRAIKDLHPDLQFICAEFIKKCSEQGADIILTCTYRSNEEQDREFARGRTVSSGIDVVPVIRPLGRIVTNARAGQSAHNFTINGKPAAKAFDIVPVVNGRAIWAVKHPAWQIAGKIGQDLGLVWYGAPGSHFREMPHFEMRDWRTTP